MWYLQQSVVYTHTCGNRNHATFLNKEVVICTCAPPNSPEYSFNFTVSWQPILSFIKHLVWIFPFNRCDTCMFVTGGACASIRYCTSIRINTVPSIINIKEKKYTFESRCFICITQKFWCMITQIKFSTNLMRNADQQQWNCFLDFWPQAAFTSSFYYHRYA